MTLTSGDLLVLTAGDTARVVSIDGSTITLLCNGMVIRGTGIYAHKVIRLGVDHLAEVSGEDVVTICTSDDSIRDIWSMVGIDDAEDFATIANALLPDITVRACTDCDEPEEEDEGRTGPDGFICSGCFDDNYLICGRCSTIVRDDDSYSTYGGNSDSVCNRCYEDHYSTCERCEDVVRCDDMNTLSGDYYWCDNCRDYAAHWCDDCDSYVRDDDDCDHEPDPSAGCSHGGCEAPHLDFHFLANGDGTVGNDERLTVELPAGAISDEGIFAITQVVWAAVTGDARYGVERIVGGLEPVWQTKQGNFTRRLSSALYKEHKAKLPAETISEVGNIAKAHTLTTSTWNIEFTRDLNQSASEFSNDESCWWQSYAYSRCALKSWGGLAIRTFADEYGYLTGRAWVQPLNSDMQPTHDALNAFAFVVYNGYESLEGYAAVRILAHLTGRTYRKVALSINGQYVNNNSGYLVADAATCLSTSSIAYGGDVHHQHDASSIDHEESAA
jgi:hypothetical protein